MQLEEESKKAAGNGNAINSELGELKEHKPEKSGDEEEGGEGAEGGGGEEGPRPILPYSSLFILENGSFKYFLCFLFLNNSFLFS